MCLEFIEEHTYLSVRSVTFNLFFIFGSHKIFYNIKRAASQNERDGN